LTCRFPISAHLARIAGFTLLGLLASLAGPPAFAQPTLRLNCDRPVIFWTRPLTGGEWTARNQRPNNYVSIAIPDEPLELRVQGYANPLFDWVGQKDEVSPTALQLDVSTTRALSPTRAVLLVALLAAILGIGGLFVLRRQRRASRDHLGRLHRLEQIKIGSSEPRAGSRIGDYVIDSRLGQGGMGVVYRAVPFASLDPLEAVALKIFHPQGERREEFLVRFQRECQLVAALSHPTIVRVYDFGEQDEVPYLVMELVEGESLDSLVPPQGLDLADVRELCLPVFDGLACAHEKGIVHRDIKPGNIMKTRSGKIKILDFGLARRRNLPKVSVTGQIMGTPAYIPPEQIRGGTDLVEPRSDQYSLGIMLFELLTGSTPFQGDDPIALALQHMSQAPPALRERRPDLPQELEAVLSRMLQKDPQARYESILDAKRAFEQISQAAVLDPL
jgi:serine/threonine-protein kinase